MKIIVAPLNWGLGHASRCVPIIKKLKQLGFSPIIASDGNALNFLQKEFPELDSFELPSYKIQYGKNLKLSLLSKFFSIRRTVKNEHKVIADYISKNDDVVGIISDNRFGVYHSKMPSVYITHQVKVFAGVFTFFTSFVHQRIIEKFDELWIPDDYKINLSGELSNPKSLQISHHFIGNLSRLHKEKLPKKWDITILLSGPEPRRTYIEEKLIDRFKKTSKTVLLIQGKIEKEQKWFQKGNVEIVNFLLSKELKQTLNSSELIIARSGYSSIMDLSCLEKKALLIPTKGQNEQEYLARHLNNKFGIQFIIEKEIETLDFENVEGDSIRKVKTKLEDSLFSLFQSK